MYFWNFLKVVYNNAWEKWKVVNKTVETQEKNWLNMQSYARMDVEPYTVVGGNPIRFIRKRYNDASIGKLLKVQWWNLREDELKEALPYILKEDIYGLVKKVLELRVIREIENII